MKTPKDNLFADYPLAINRSDRAKRLALRLDPKDRIIRLTIPKRLSDATALDFVRDHEDWIFEKIAELPPPLPFEQGKVIPVLGQNYKIEIDFDETRKSTDIFFEGQSIVIQTNKEDPANRLTRWLKELARTEITMRAQDKAAQIEKNIATISIRDTKSRWGSCGSDGSLNFSWRLIFAPLESLDYVIAHEVAHLVHMDHSRKFWALCRSLSDDFTEGSYWMRNHGHELMRYGF